MKMENILKKIKIKRSELRASLGELNRDLRIVSGTSTRRLIEAEIVRQRDGIERLSVLIEKRSI